MANSKVWSKRELVILRKYYPEYGALALTKVLKGKTENQIKYRAKVLGLRADASEVNTT